MTLLNNIAGNWCAGSGMHGEQRAKAPYGPAGFIDERGSGLLVIRRVVFPALKVPIQNGGSSQQRESQRKI